MNTYVPTAEAVMTLRKQTGAGIVAVKQALIESKGDAEAATTSLRKKYGIDRRTNATTQGLVESYIHMGRIGVLMELGCETDFVARHEDFKALAKELCLQVASLRPTYVCRTEIPQDIVMKELSICLHGLDGKPLAIRDKIAAGKLENFYAQVCLVDQPYVKDPTKKVKQLIEDLTVRVRETIAVKRFVRFELGT